MILQIEKRRKLTGGKKIAQHRKLYELLRRHITEGVYPEGGMLPSENELCALHNVTRPTVRQALSKLENEGYISRHQGKGSIVRAIPHGIGILSIQGTTSSIGQKNLVTKTVLKPKVIHWPDSFMFELSEPDIEIGCITLERQRIVDNIPIFYDISYLPNINLPRFTQKSFENRSLFTILRTSYGIEVIGGEQKIRAVKANENLSKYLDVKVGDPVLQLQRKMQTNRFRYCFYSSIYCNTEDFYLEGTF